MVMNGLVVFFLIFDGPDVGYLIFRNTTLLLKLIQLIRKKMVKVKGITLTIFLPIGIKMLKTFFDEVLTFYLADTVCVLFDVC